MQNKDEDQDWLDTLAGKPNANADPEVTRRATALHRAIQKYEDSLQVSEFDEEAALQKLKFRMRREGLSGSDQRKTMNKRFTQFAMAASVILTVGLVMRLYLHQEPIQNEMEIMRGMGERQIVLATVPEVRLKQLTTELDQLGIKYQTERKDNKIILTIQGINPEKDEVASFLGRNHITPPVRADVVLDIRPMAKP